MRLMPEVQVTFVEEPAPKGLYVAKDVGEIGVVPKAGAVGAALRAFDGKRRTTLRGKGSSAARTVNVDRIADADREQWH